MRFYIEYGQTAPYIALRDRQKHNEVLFSIDLTATPASQERLSYAVISRVVGQLTEQPVLMLAGLGREGTVAASEFVTQEKYLRTFEQRAPKDWAAKNMQVVISNEVVEGDPGPPRIVAIHCW
jgi:hypothetical protein